MLHHNYYIIISVCNYKVSLLFSLHNYSFLAILLVQDNYNCYSIAIDSIHEIPHTYIIYLNY